MARHHQSDGQRRGFPEPVTQSRTHGELAGRRSRHPLTSPEAPGVTRTYTDWKTISDNVINARVWEGGPGAAPCARSPAVDALRHVARVLRTELSAAAGTHPFP